MASNTQFDPQRVADFEKSKMTLDAKGALYQAAPGVVSNLDFRVADDSCLLGGTLIVKGSTFGDFVDLKIVDVDGIYQVPGAPDGVHFPPGTVLNTFMTSWYLQDDPQTKFKFDSPFPAKVYAGLYLRGVYHSTAPALSMPIGVAINYQLHRILV